MTTKTKFWAAAAVVAVIIMILSWSGPGKKYMTGIYDSLLKSSEAEYKAEIAKRDARIADLESRLKELEKTHVVHVKRAKSAARKAAEVRPPETLEATKKESSSLGFIPVEQPKDSSQLVCYQWNDAAKIMAELKKKNICHEETYFWKAAHNDLSEQFEIVKQQRNTEREKSELADREREKERKILEEQKKAMDRQATKEKFLWGAGGIGVGVLIGAALLLL